MIAIVDFGSQTTHLIGRRFRDMGVEVRILEPETAYKRMLVDEPKGIVLSGGPASVYADGSPTVDRRLYDLGVPILGICYGWQLTAKLLEGVVERGNSEYGPTEMMVDDAPKLFDGLKSKKVHVWMSHGDEVRELPKGFEYLASTPGVKAAGVGDTTRKIYGVQFHPEVEHTQEGGRILQNFAEKISGLSVKPRTLAVEPVINEVRKALAMYGKKVRAIAAVSGGVDSTVAGAIVAKVMGERFVPVYCDNGLMREGTREQVEYIFGELLRSEPVIIDCKERFLKALEGVTDPERKRKIIGNLYIKEFEAAADEIDNVKLLVQGTIYSDVIESQGTTHASKIKSHHNVGGLPEKMKLDLLEPVREFYKDEVRELGRQMGFPEEVLMQQPFPGPGQAIRIIGEITNERLEKQYLADKIVLEVLRDTGWYEQVFQSFPVLTGIRSTAVKGDGRVYGEVVGVRVYGSSDVMTAGWSHLPYEVLQELSSRIVNEVPDVSRVVYDITTKPPATMEWE